MRETKGNFSLESYRNILKKAKGFGFHFQTFSEYLEKAQKKVILIRHDVDISPKFALKMARVEHELNVHSTYFVRVHSTRYNLFDRFNYERLQELLSLGFEIGVHQEVCNFAKNGEEAIELLEREKLVIEGVLGEKVYGVATHLPKRNTFQITLDIIKKIGLRYRPDDEVFNRDAIFVSDSNNHWKKYALDEALLINDKILANIHPVWWVEKVEDVEGLIEFLKEGN